MYNNSVLKYLNPLWVLADLRILLGHDGNDEDIPPFWENPDIHVALICYEKPSDFCHRHLIAKWLRAYGVECTEWEDTE